MTQQTSPLPQAPNFCLRHPDTESNLRCSKCDSYICPRCLVMTPVGARCPDCAHVQALPQFEVKPIEYARGTGAAAGVALVAGAIWAILPFGNFLGFLFGIGAGFAISEGMNAATNRRQSTGLKIIAACGVVLTFLFSQVIGIILAFGMPSNPEVIPVLFIAAFQGMMSPFTLIIVGLGAFFAVTRIG